MKKSTPSLLDIIHELVTAARVKEKFDTDPDFSLKLEQEQAGHMPLVIEAYAAGNSYQGEKRHVKIYHYYEQNGDLVPDPELLMTDLGHPIFIRTTFSLSQVLSKDLKMRTVLNTQALRLAQDLMEVWAETIQFHNWLETAKAYKENGGGR